MSHTVAHVSNGQPSPSAVSKSACSRTAWSRLDICTIKFIAHTHNNAYNFEKKLYLPTEDAIDVTDAYELHRNNNNDFQLGKNDILDDNRRCFLNWWSNYKDFATVESIITWHEEHRCWEAWPWRSTHMWWIQLQWCQFLCYQARVSRNPNGNTSKCRETTHRLSLFWCAIFEGYELWICNLRMDISHKTQDIRVGLHKRIPMKWS